VENDAPPYGPREGVPLRRRAQIRELRELPLGEGVVIGTEVGQADDAAAAAARGGAG
jgi:hypothetical protein